MGVESPNSNVANILASTEAPTYGNACVLRIQHFALHHTTSP